MADIEIGITTRISRRVADQHLATSLGSGLAAVLSTPALVAFCEECARMVVDPLLPGGQETVGTQISLRHLAATPPGMWTTVEATLTAIDGRRLRFRIEAWDEAERIAEAEHERTVIDGDRFRRRLREKSDRVAKLTQFSPV